MRLSFSASKPRVSWILEISRIGEIPYGEPHTGIHCFTLYDYPAMAKKLASYSQETASAPTGCEANLPPRILVVEDDSEILLLSAEMLTSSGFHVDTAEHGATAWEALNARPYDLLITDNNMPNLTGIELIQKLRSARMALPVILASGAIPENTLPLQLAAILQKPYTLDELLGTVKEVLHAPDGPDEPMEPPVIDVLRL